MEKVVERPPLFPPQSNDLRTWASGFTLSIVAILQQYGYRLNRVLPMDASEPLELQEFADDSAAEAGGVPVGGLYRTGSVVKVRVT